MKSQSDELDGDEKVQNHIPSSKSRHDHDSAAEKDDTENNGNDDGDDENESGGDEEDDEDDEDNDDDNEVDDENEDENEDEDDNDEEIDEKPEDGEDDNEESAAEESSDDESKSGRDSDNAKDDDNDSSDDEEEEGDDDDGSSKKIVTEDGREISEYEMLRLERIRRNKEKLAQLGLEGQSGAGVLGEKKKAKKKIRRPSIENEGPKRSSLSRRSKGKVKHYATELPSVREMLKTHVEKEKKKEKVDKPKKKKKDPSERMEKNLHDEFRRIRSQKRYSLIQAEKDNRAAIKEVKFWANHIEAAKRKEIREQKRLSQQLHKIDEEREALGGKTARELLKEVDDRMPDLMDAAEKYDEVYEAAARQHERELQRFEMDERLKTIDALEKVPKSLKDATTLLNTVLLERSPKDPPPPRRSKRSGDEPNADEEVKTPQKKKAKSKESDANTWTDAPAAAVNLPTTEEETGKTQSPQAATAGKKRKRGVRNVGGWVSPEWASKLSRSWLERDSPPATFDLKTFVPQVGDLLLYYPTGHYNFLTEYPDILGKKTRQTTRVPLWERLGSSANNGGDTSQEMPWGTNEWAKGIVDPEKQGGKYPILCTVQIVCAEFPPDPNIKVVKNKEGADGEVVKKLFFKGPKEGTKKASKEVRLAVTLKPISAILPESGLSLPPTFSVVTFPSKLKPFLVPFAWAFSLTQSMAQDVTVVSRDDPSALKRITKVDVPTYIPHGGRLDVADASAFIRTLGDESTRRSKLWKLLADDQRQLPFCDALVVLDIFEKCGKKAKPDTSREKIDFIDIICKALPVWESLTVTSKDVYDRKKRTTQTMSPWELRVAQKTQQAAEPDPDTIAELPSDRDEPLRIRIEAVCEEVVKDHPSGSLFVDPINDDIAPSYSCAVPVGMSMSRIRKRLRGTPKAKKCFYRSVGSLLADVSAIVENCLLYNSPESEIVESAVEVVTGIKDGIARVVRDHNKAINAVHKADEERRRHVMQLVGSAAHPTSQASASVCRIRKPYKHQLHRDWLQRTGSELPGQANDGNSIWIPQAGDDILYSRERHAAFVKGHHSALELDQCEVLGEGHRTGTRADSDIWLSGKVVWTKAAFPRAPLKKETETIAFSTDSTLLAVGAVFSRAGDEDQKVQVIYWRPCMFPSDRNSGCNGRCELCGLCLQSFLRPVNDAPQLLSPEHSASIECCLRLLKKRLLGGDAVFHINPRLNKASIKQGFELPSSREELHNLSSHEGFIEPWSGLEGHTTRKGVVRFYPPPAELTSSGYLAHWMAENQTTSDKTLPKHHETISPWPKLCLEVIRLRLEKGYYRTRTAVENDMIEAFSSVVFMSVAEAVNHKKTPLSMKKLAKLLASYKLKSQEASVEESISEEDISLKMWLMKLLPIRDLYSSALSAVADTERFERVTGLYIKIPPIVDVEALAPTERQSQSQIEAREKLRCLMEALKRDKLSEEFFRKGAGESPVPSTKLSVICNGEKTEYEKFLTTLKHGQAKIEGKETKVKIICDGKEIHVDREISGKTTLNARLNGSDVILRLRSNGEDILVPNTSLLPRNASGVREVIRDHIMIGARELEISETLVKFLFGRPSRQGTCARCSAHRRTMLVCRVRRAHVNIDFDWLEFFRGTESLDGILKAMKSESQSTLDNDSSPTEQGSQQKDSIIDGTVADHVREAPVVNELTGNEKRNRVQSSSDATVDLEKVNMANNEKCNIEESNGNEQMEQSQKEKPKVVQKRYSTRRTSAIAKNIDPSLSPDEEAPGAIDPEERKSSEGRDNSASKEVESLQDGKHNTEKTENDENMNSQTENQPGNHAQTDPEEALRKAESTLQLSEVVLDEARRYAKAPARLSKTFVEASIPRDSEDNKFIYCIICGMSGNLLCCDGCSNVVHNGCIGLEQVPEDEWFCEECNIKKNTIAENEGQELAESNKKLPFDRFDFDQDRADRLSSLVQELRDLRPDGLSKKKKKAKSRTGHGDSDSEASDREDGTSNEIDSSDPLNSLTDTAKQFLCSIKVTNFSDFLETKTSLVANKLSKWRKKEGLPELRGSGPTAYISMWKRTCRDIADQRGLKLPKEGGGVIWKEDSDVDTDAESNSRNGRGRSRSRKKKTPRKNQVKKQITDPWDALSSTSQEFLRTIGVRDADSFIEMRTTDIAQKFVKWRKKNKLPKLKSNGEIATISAWKTAVRNASGSLTTPKRKQKVDETPPSPPSPPSFRGTPTPSRAERLKKRAELSPIKAHTSSTNKKYNNKVDEASEDESKPPYDDPLDALPSSAREFLKEAEIESAEKLLSMRSGDVGAQLGQWRKRNGMSKLKGSGEGATVSAWKTACRNAIATLERYWERTKVEEGALQNKATQALSDGAQQSNDNGDDARSNEEAGSKTMDSSKVIEVHQPSRAGLRARRSSNKRHRGDVDNESTSSRPKRKRK